MKAMKKLAGAVIACLLMLGIVGTVPAEAATLIRSVLSYDAYMEPADRELYGNYQLFFAYQSGFLIRADADGSNWTDIVMQDADKNLGAVANGTSVLYSLYKKNTLTVWKTNLATMKKTKVTAISIKAKEASICGFYNNVLYYSATSRKGAHLMFSYPLSTKVSKKMGSGVIPRAQVSRYLIYYREKLDGTEGYILKSYDIRNKTGVTVDNAAETAVRIGKYLYYTKYGYEQYVVAGSLQRIPMIEAYRYDLDAHTSKKLLSTGRESYGIYRVTSKGLYLHEKDSTDAWPFFFVDYNTGKMRKAEFGEISPV